MDLNKLASSLREAAEIISNQSIDSQQRTELSQACESLSAIIEEPRSRLEKATHAVLRISRVMINLFSHYTDAQ